MRVILAALIIFLQCSLLAHADSAADEISHLLKFVRESPCNFIRNGSAYDGAAAADHVEAKYEHFKREIKTAEDFIARAATKSLMSGAPYQVQCGSASPTAAAGWLLDELHSYRAQHGTPTAP
jgi:hypothetical protein